MISAKHDRFKAVGEFNGAVLTVIFKPLGTEAISVIAMRRASRKEKDPLMGKFAHIPPLTDEEEAESKRRSPRIPMMQKQLIRN